MRRPLSMMQGQERLRPSWPATRGLTCWTVVARITLAWVTLAWVTLWAGAHPATAQSLRQPNAIRPRTTPAVSEAGPRVDDAASAAETSSTVALQPPDARTAAEVAAERDAAYQELAQEVSELQRLTRAMRRVVELATPCVVHIESYHVEPGAYGRTREVEEAGSGVIVRMLGKFHIITNRHVVKGARLTNIRLQLDDGRTLRPTRVTEDAGTDVAVVTVADDGLIEARLGDSDQIEIGDIVMAMGSPFGLSHSVTLGIISAKGRRDLELGREVDYQDFIQTDAAINPGNSGGPLLSLRGEVIGLNTAIASNSGGNEGIGFAIPINIVMLIAEQLIQNGHVTHAYLGVTLDNEFDSDDARRLGVEGQRGALVKAITPGSPAAVAQLRPLDVILQFNGTPIESDSHLVNLVGLTAPENPVTMAVLRGGKIISVAITLQDRKAFEKK